jgi:transposase
MCQTTLDGKDSGSDVLLAALELSDKTWKVAFAGGGRTSLATMKSGDLGELVRQCDKAKERFGLRPKVPVVSCYEAGRDGFWLHRALVPLGVENIVVDSASIEVDRRHRRAKTDRLDARRLLAQLQRFHAGERRAFHIVAVPSVADEDARRRHRELERLRRERTAHNNRMRSLLVLHGIRLSISLHFREQLAQERGPEGNGIPAHLEAELLREYERWRLVNQQIQAVETERRNELAEQRKQLAQRSADPQIRTILQLNDLCGIGTTSAEVFVREVFGWRQFRNRRQLAASVGLVPTPFASGGRETEQGISKAGNKRVRRVLLEIAWCWLRYQPESRLTLWFHERFGGSGRMRRIGIVALARRLLIELWRYVQTGVLPEGAQLKPAA